MGWNSIENLRSGLFDGIDEGSYVYYVHSYAPEINADTIATTTYGVPFSAAIHKDNFYGTQFHPEKECRDRGSNSAKLSEIMITIIPAIDMIGGECVRLTQGRLRPQNLLL